MRAALLCLGMIALLGTAGLPGAAAAEGTGLLRLAHLSPDTPAVDVAVAAADGTGTTVAGLAYGSVSPYQQLPPGRYAVSVRAAGAAPATPPVLSAFVDLSAGAARTVALEDRFADLRLAVFADATQVPSPGSTTVRVVAAAAGAPTLGLARAAGPPLATDLRFPGAGQWATVPAGPTTLRLAVDGRPAADLPLDLPDAAVVTLLVLDRPDGGFTVQPVVDSAGLAVVPAGSVDAGGGGTAGGVPGIPAAAFVATALALLVAARRPAVVPLVLAAALGAALVPAPAPAAATEPLAAPVVHAGPSAGPSRPVRVQVPAVGLDAPVTEVGLDGAGALAAPADVGTAGWFGGGPAPGAAGPAVIAGHVDSRSGPAVFFRLRAVAAGDAVLVARADGSTARFVVTRVARYPKAAFPTAEVYGPTAGAELRLITCGGAFDRAAGSYTDNVVVFARLG